MRGITHGAALTGAIALVSACAIDNGPAGEAHRPRTIAVAPRVVMDGLVALGARADRVVIDEVMFHAPSVRVEQDGNVVDDVLAGEAPLLFRYDVSSNDGFGNVLGGERSWAIGADGELVFGFEKFDVDTKEIQRLQTETGVDLEELTGHTAVVHGYMLTASGPHAATAAAGPITGFTAQDHHSTAEGDPDGNPAQGDPDGNPAHPKGSVADGDPDGNPAHPGGVHLRFGSYGSYGGDPDGNPSQDPESAASGRHVDRGLSALTPVGVHDRGSYTPVPFFLVLNNELELRVPVASLHDVGDGEVQPIDLHVQLDALLTDDLLHTLDEQAADGMLGTIVVVVTAGNAVGLDTRSHGVTRPKPVPVSTGGIRVVGDAR